MYNLFLATAELLVILPYPSISIYMYMLQEVTRTFMKFLTIFMFVIVAFTFSFCVVFQPSNSGSVWNGLKKNWTTYIDSKNGTALFAEYREPAFIFVDTLEQVFDDDSVFQNFKRPFSAFLKTVQMLSGDFAIDPFSLGSISKEILLFIFIITSFILFNLINGLAISDIALLKQQAEYLSLKQQVENLSETEGVICDIYEKMSDNFDENSNLLAIEEKNAHMLIKNSRKWYRRFGCYLITILVRKYPFVHKMENLCVDFEHKRIKYEQDDRRFFILQQYSGTLEKYHPDQERLKDMSDIVVSNQSQEKNINEEIENLQQELKNVKMQMTSQYEEIKRLLENLTNAANTPMINFENVN